jgi:hypothetical protein
LKKVLHTIEFQKRGLATDTSQPTPELIDSFISAEILDPVTDPLAYALVAEHMVHGPCGKLNPKSPCMKDGKWTKNYPKPVHDETLIDENGFAIYRSRDDGKFILKGNIKLDNRWITAFGSLESYVGNNSNFLGKHNIIISFILHILPIIIQYEYVLISLPHRMSWGLLLIYPKSNKFMFLGSYTQLW